MVQRYRQAGLSVMISDVLLITDIDKVQPIIHKARQGKQDKTIIITLKWRSQDIGGIDISLKLLQ